MTREERIKMIQLQRNMNFMKDVAIRQPQHSREISKQLFILNFRQQEKKPIFLKISTKIGHMGNITPAPITCPYSDEAYNYYINQEGKEVEKIYE